MTQDNDQEMATNRLSDKDAAPDLWELVLLGRVGRPPLRFRGQRIAHLHRSVGKNASIFIDVWARKRGDYVIAHSDLSGGTLKSDAHIITCIADVAEHLEKLCKDEKPTQPETDLFSMLPKLLRVIAFRQQFAILAGDFLASFDAYCARHFVR